MSQYFHKLKPYTKPNWKKSCWQLVTSLLVLFLSILMAQQDILLFRILSWPIALVMLMRLVIIQHDCGHHSFFKKKEHNILWGHLLSLCTTIPFSYWCLTHDIHHTNQGNLSLRTENEYPTYTTKEYLALSPKEQRRYRLIRSPLGVILILPLVLSLVLYRVPNTLARKHRCTISMLSLDILLFLIGMAAYATGCLFWLLSLQLVLMCIAFFFFYIQHQYIHSYWAENSDFDFTQAACKGSSFLIFPKWLHWCTGNIGYHHIHHLCTQVPNYSLPEAHHSLNPPTENMHLSELLQTFEAALWDEQEQKMVPFPKG